MRQTHMMGSDISEDTYVDNHNNILDKLYEFYVVETDESILVKHRESVTKHYKEASIERFNLKFYGIALPNVSANHSEEKQIIRQGLNDYTQDN